MAKSTKAYGIAGTVPCKEEGCAFCAVMEKINEKIKEHRKQLVEKGTYRQLRTFVFITKHCGPFSSFEFDTYGVLILRYPYYTLRIGKNGVAV